MRNVASHLPARSAGIVQGGFVGMALGAKPPRETLEQIWIVRAMRLVTFGAALAGVSGDGIVLIDERPLELGMARDALLLERFPSADDLLRRMRIVAIAADEPSFGNRVVRGLSELSGFASVARGAEDRFVRFEQLG